MLRRIGIVGAPLCDGEREIGVEKAPRAIRSAGLVDSLKGGTEVRDFGDIPLGSPFRDSTEGKLRNTRHVVKGCARISQEVARVAADGYVPLVLGGDCSLFHGAVVGITSVHRETRVLYVDGHADFHTPETTSSGYFSGMALALAVGKSSRELKRLGYKLPSVKEENVSVVGVRRQNIDPLELENLEKTQVKVITIESLRNDGFVSSLEKTAVATENKLYLHFDLDVIDANEMPALAGTSAGVHSSGGLSYEEALSLCRLMGRLPLVGMDITLYDPNLDPTGSCARKVVSLLTAILS